LSRYFLFFKENGQWLTDALLFRVLVRKSLTCKIMAIATCLLLLSNCRQEYLAKSLKELLQR